MVNKRINFAVENAEVIEVDNNSQFVTARISAFSTGATRNDTTCDVDALKACAPTIFEKPIIYTIDNRFQDFYTHVDPDKTLICGFVSPDSASFIEENGRTTLTVLAKIWRRYSENFINIFKQDKTDKKKVSVEVELFDSEEQPDGLLKMKRWIFDGICVLGDLITEASKGANIQLLSFAEDQKDYNRDLVLEFGKYDHIDFTIPGNVKTNAEKGLKLYKENSRGASSISLAVAHHLIKNDKASHEKIRHIAKVHNSTKFTGMKKSPPSNEYITFMLYGGEDGRLWSVDLDDKLNQSDNQHLSYFGLEVTMPYDKISDANPAIRGIDPPVSLGQANAIAKQADAIGSDKEKNGWAIAISSFKKTHKVVEGKWVKKDAKMSEDENFESKDSEKEELSVEDEKEKDVKEENMAEEKPEEEKQETPEEEKKEEEEEKKEQEEEKKEEDKEKKMSLDANLDVAVLLQMLEDETEGYKTVVEAEFAKEEGEKNFAAVCYAMYCKMCKMAAEKVEMCGKMAKMEEDSKAYMEENMALKEFKAKEEEKQFKFAIDTTMKEIEESVEMPKIEKEGLLEESKNFTLSTVDAWKNLARARAFEFAKKGKKEEDGIKRYGLPWGDLGAKPKNESVWKNL